MGLAMEPQCQRMAVGSGSFQACPNLWHVVLLEDAGQLSKALEVVIKAKAHFVARASQLGLHAGFGHVEAKHRQRDSDMISGVHFLFPFDFFSFCFIGRSRTGESGWLFEDTRHWRPASMRYFCWIGFALYTLCVERPCL